MHFLLFLLAQTLLYFDSLPEFLLHILLPLYDLNLGLQRAQLVTAEPLLLLGCCELLLQVVQGGGQLSVLTLHPLNLFLFPLFLGTEEDYLTISSDCVIGQIAKQLNWFEAVMGPSDF
jgi:hypothetical protein